MRTGHVLSNVQRRHWWQVIIALWVVTLVASGIPARATQPPAPTNLEAHAVYHSAVVLQWDWEGPDDPTAQSRFEIRWHEVGNPDNGGATNASPWYSPSGAVHGLSPSTPYVFEVVRIDGAGNESNPSNQITITTQEMPTPTNLEASANGFSEIRLSWDRDGRGFSGEKHLVRWYPADEPTDVTVTEVNPFTRSTWFRGLSPQTTYQFDVVYVLEDGTESDRSNQATATSGAHEPPQDLSVVSATDTTADLTWTGASRETYRIFWHEVGNSDDIESTDVRGDAGSVSGLSPETAYLFEVFYVDRFGNEWGPSNQVTFTTLPHDPPTVEAERSGNSVTLTWPRGFPSGEGSTYYVYADGVLERRWAWFGDQVQVTLPRQRSNTTIRYTVESDRWNAPTPPVAVTLPTSNDSTPPTDPVWIKAAMGEVCDEFSITITEESTDDVTPQERIRYEGLRFDAQADAFFVHDYNLSVFDFEGVDRLRAVDEAGNRSAMVAPSPCDLD